MVDKRLCYYYTTLVHAYIINTRVDSRSLPRVNDLYRILYIYICPLLLSTGRAEMVLQLLNASNSKPRVRHPDAGTRIFCHTPFGYVFELVFRFTITFTLSSSREYFHKITLQSSRRANVHGLIWTVFFFRRIADRMRINSLLSSRLFSPFCFYNKTLLFTAGIEIKHQHLFRYTFCSRVRILYKLYYH